MLAAGPAPFRPYSHCDAYVNTPQIFAAVVAGHSPLSARANYNLACYFARTGATIATAGCPPGLTFRPDVRKLRAEHRAAGCGHRRTRRCARPGPDARPLRRDSWPSQDLGLPLDLERRFLRRVVPTNEPVSALLTGRALAFNSQNMSPEPGAPARVGRGSEAISEHIFGSRRGNSSGAPPSRRGPGLLAVRLADPFIRRPDRSSVGPRRRPVAYASRIFCTSSASPAIQCEAGGALRFWRTSKPSPASERPMTRERESQRRAAIG
jgi:hypothetical protein